MFEVDVQRHSTSDLSPAGCRGCAFACHHANGWSPAAACPKTAAERGLSAATSVPGRQVAFTSLCCACTVASCTAGPTSWWACAMTAVSQLSMIVFRCVIVAALAGLAAACSTGQQLRRMHLGSCSVSRVGQLWSSTHNTSVVVTSSGSLEVHTSSGSALRAGEPIASSRLRELVHSSERDHLVCTVTCDGTTACTPNMPSPVGPVLLTARIPTLQAKWMSHPRPCTQLS